MGWNQVNARPAAEAELLARAACWPNCPSLAELTPQVLQGISAQQGMDFATAILYDRLQRDRPFPSLKGEEAFANRNCSSLVAVVPGAFYQEYRHTGADGERVLAIARQCGFRAERVPLASFGSVAQNAAFLRDWLKQRSGERIILASLSKGGTDVQAALTMEDAAETFAPATAWINLSGILQGTALADWLLARPIRCLFVKLLCWWRGYRFEVLREMQRKDAGPLRWPAHLRVVHVVGFPLRRHLHNRLARRAHRRLTPWGPSDGGGILLADACRWPGDILPVWGADHYLRQEQVDAAALVKSLLLHLEQPCGEPGTTSLAGKERA